MLAQWQINLPPTALTLLDCVPVPPVRSLFSALRQYLQSQLVHQLVFDFQNWLRRQMRFDEQTTGPMYEAQTPAVVSQPLVLKRDVAFGELAHVKTPLPPTDG